MAYISLSQLKEQLNIEQEFVSDDGYLTQLISVSELAIDNYCNAGLSGYTANDIPVTVQQAALLLASHFYLNRQIVSFAQGVEIPYTFQFLLNPYKNYVIQ